MLQEIAKYANKNFIKNHILILLIFVFFTGVFTFPSFLNFDSLIGNHGDPDVFLSAFWWYNFNIENPTTDDLSWLFYNSYQFYPHGSPINYFGSLNTIFSVFFYSLIDDFVQVYNLLIYLGFIF